MVASVRLTEAEDALKALSGYIARAQDKRGMFENIGMSLVVSTQNRFERGQAPDGSPWPPSIRALATGGKTLIESARLMRSMTYNATDTSLEVGTNVIYAAIHQFGGSINQAARKGTINYKVSKTGKRLAGFRKKGKGTTSQDVSIGARVIHMPARPFLGLDDDDEREIIKLAEEHIAGEGAQP